MKMYSFSIPYAQFIQFKKKRERPQEKEAEKKQFAIAELKLRFSDFISNTNANNNWQTIGRILNIW